MPLLCGGSKTAQRKLVLLGDGASGKTSLLNVFTRGYFPTVYEPTVFENYVHDIFVDNVHIELSLWDTAGQEEFDRLRSLSYDDTDLIMLCYSVDSKDSLENVESKWVGEIADNCPGVKLVLVALKCDLREGSDEDADDRGATAGGPTPATAVGGAPSPAANAAGLGNHGNGAPVREKKPMINYDQGLEVARRINAMRYLECSAMRNRGVNEAFTEAARVALSVRKEREGSSCAFEAAAADALLGGWDDDAVAGEDSRNDNNNGRPSGTKPTSIGDGGAHHGRPPTFIVDAIDNIDTKVELLRYCHARGLPVVASMGAGTKSDPTRVVVGDLGASTADGLSRAVRRRLKLLGITHGIPAVYSTEMTKDAEEEPNTTTSGISKAALLPLPEEQFAKGKAAVRELGALPTFRVRILPVLGTLPAVFGHTVANHILLTVSGYPYEYSAVKGRDKLYDQILGVVLAAEERLVRHREATLVNGGTPPPDDKDVASDKEVATKKAAKTAKKAAAGPGPSAAVGLRVPLTACDVAFLVEVYHGRSAVSGLPTRTTLVRWALPPDDDGTAAARLKLADLVCMTREEASRHTAAVLLGGGQSPADLYDVETLARIEARRRVAAAYEQYRV
ncbi:ubiquitin-activating protein [Niveomyces insectorum RCEF 264]|uniref:Ubiquitin-activating protein n=1 Tax=Niveomyces insectorum RCEF 264 TaxID=1081102 RepID=A0A167UMV2_9HYPO|nr:ubiquitin-activating protein [Niveomyces insectorum RCEF 264]